MNSRLATVRNSRDDLYACLYRRADALFALTDALLTAGPLPAPVHLSGGPAHRRGWGSLYTALIYGRLNETDLRAAALLPSPRRPTGLRPRLRRFVAPQRRARTGAPSTIPRAISPTSPSWPARTINRSPRSASHGGAGPPLNVRRVHLDDNAIDIAAAQFARLLPRLPGDGPVPLFVVNAGYDAVVLQQGLAERVAVAERAGTCACAPGPGGTPTGRTAPARAPRGPGQSSA